MRELTQRGKLFILGGVLLAMLLGALDQMVVGPAMKTIIEELGSFSLFTWVATAYILTSTISIPIVGKLSDLYGRKWFYLSGIGVFVLGSALSGAAGSAFMNTVVTTVLRIDDPHPMVQLILFRALQGLGGGTMMANAFAVIGDLWAPRERARYQGLMGAMFGLASVVGPFVGGWFTDNLSWRWIFYINLPLGFFAMAILWFALPTPRRGQRHAVDWFGSLALAVGLVPLLLALVWGGDKYAWGSPMILGLLAVAGVALFAFLLIERRATEPILDLGLFRSRLFSVGSVATFLSGVGMFGSMMFLPIFMQMVQGKTATHAGSLLTPMMLSLVGTSIVTGQVIARTGKYKLVGIVGFSVATYGMFRLSGIDIHTGDGEVLLDMFLIGSGMGVGMPLFTVAFQSAFPQQIGAVTAASQFFRSIGGVVGMALLGGVMNASLKSNLQGLIVGHKDKLGPLGDKLAQIDRPEGLLDPMALGNMRAGIMRLGEGMGSQVQQQLSSAFGVFQADLKLALAQAISHTFFLGFVVLACAAVAMLFIEEVPLLGRAPGRSAAGEAGVELLDELAVIPEDEEPAVGAGAAK